MDRSGQNERAQDQKIGQAITEAMKQIKRQEAERKTPAPGKIIQR